MVTLVTDLAHPVVQNSAMPSTHKFLWIITLLSVFVFIGMSVDSLHRMSSSTHDDQISAQVVEGKRLWQHYDCNDCHTILGIGAYYAPDVTKAYSKRGETWLRKFLEDPAAMYPHARQMPNNHLSRAQIDALVAYFAWVSRIETNGWPPAPQGVARAESPGNKLFLALECNTCHSIQGSGGTLAPDLTHEGSKRGEDWIVQELNDPRRFKADSIMPSFAQLSESDKQQLTDYLASLK
jgi:nitric oxide reductase subunit C